MAKHARHPKDTRIDPGSQSWPALVGDIGGTNARFAIIESQGARPSQILSLKDHDYPDLSSVIAAYIRQVDSGPIRRAALAVAGPIEGDVFRFSNIDWSFSVTALAAKLGIESLRLINDFEALALAVPRLEDSAFLRIGAGHACDTAPLAVIGPGTGLGVAGLLRDAEGWRAIATEGGHSDFAPGDELEIELLRLLRRQCDGHVSAEHVLCGDGIARMHDALALIDGTAIPRLPTADIIARSNRDDGDPACVRTLSLYCEILGGFVGNVALIAGARGGVVLGGGILPRIPRHLSSGGFRRRFEAKGRMNHYLAAIETRLILASDAALRGAAASLEQRA